MSMEFLNSKKFIAIVLLVLLCAALFGCAKKPNESYVAPTVYTYPEEKNVATSHPVIPVEEKSIGSKFEPSIGQMESIANVLGCVFAPASCEDKN